MNTLQAIADMKQTLATMEDKLALFEKLVAGTPKAIQDIGSMRNDLAQINQAISNVVTAVNKRTGDLNQMDNMIITRLMGLEQSFASLSKTLAAVVAELSSTKVLDEKSVIERIRRSDEAGDKARVEKLIEMKVVTESEEILSDSLIVVSQQFTSKDGKVDVVAEYRSVEMSSPEIPQEDREKYTGKRKNDVVELNLEDGVLRTTILQVYNYVQQYAASQGEQSVQADGEAKSEASTQQ